MTIGIAAYIATHYTDQLPAATGQVAKVSNAKGTPAQQRVEALVFYTFLGDSHNDLKDLNQDDITVFTTLVAVSNSNLAKVIYGMEIGTAFIGQGSPIIGELLTLFGEGSGMLETDLSF